ncbi:sulfurtransferase-like selenium metabolism protein YedF [Desulfobacter hydrogenophilus]|uniref:Sulfurtransferase-like selenium metabolism protein YedF n=1 Tax=Desulfobacter hydrogenophilus TaxID=2291 RepID=A0A328FE31_9BACT|nr:sulfurtransferase-like selenium metabolism protein YedF [Desulfobacter hydrogenophilus]NDY71679.1 sulfurtransferase-like selenium metabolism protein YedF [Desulfobacter hydrogenophilus]QBH13192.1 sulfurtransferase-like selenium metabolism protein YedF [Desulfobacter hydrogenophilus]RAM02386.1 sulfurtransferase-like selenium metabolism protein YedF [Desulfobacter hydrogenophilus]
MVKELDCRTMDCPAPVLETKKCLENEALSQIRVLVDNDAAVENVSRFLTYAGFEVSVESDGTISVVEGARDQAAAVKLASGPAARSGSDTESSTENSPVKIMVMAASNKFGVGDDDLGAKLMINFIKTLKEMGKDLWRLVFVNHGVTLATVDSAVLDELHELEASGVTILVCGTCLTHLDLMKKKAIGQTTNMLDIVTAMQLADKVINL